VARFEKTAARSAVSCLAATSAVTGSDVSASALSSSGSVPYFPTQSQVSYHSASLGPSARCRYFFCVFLLFDDAKEEANVHVNL